MSVSKSEFRRLWKFVLPKEKQEFKRYILFIEVYVGIVPILNASSVLHQLGFKHHYVQIYLGVMSVEIHKRGKELCTLAIVFLYVQDFSSFSFIFTPIIE